METSLCSPPSGPLWPVMGQGKPAGAGEGGFPKVPGELPFHGLAGRGCGAGAESFMCTGCC